MFFNKLFLILQHYLCAHSRREFYEIIHNYLKTKFLIKNQKYSNDGRIVRK